MSYSLDETLGLLAALEDARDALIDSGHLAVVVSVEIEIAHVPAAAIEEYRARAS